MHDLLAANEATGTNQIIGQVISGLILLVISIVARYLARTNKAIEKTADEQKVMVEAFKQHQYENDRDFRKMRRFMKQQKIIAERAEKAAHEERVLQVQERLRVARRDNDYYGEEATIERAGRQYQERTRPSKKR